MKKQYTGWAVKLDLFGFVEYLDRRGWSDLELVELASRDDNWPYSDRGQTFETLAEAKHARALRISGNHVNPSNLKIVRRYRWLKEVFVVRMTRREVEALLTLLGSTTSANALDELYYDLNNEYDGDLPAREEFWKDKCPEGADE